ncbi:MAG: hypothetical protein GWN58_32905 [Anaerolineae bacterium]|nr:hypothetical protein [Thermoplasmata archaeon]NIV34075.1 hypothetical protein [Anaerolineae bacterium]NIY05926.1 hypothetical protein [Thermoplasmata archaeon]
MRGELGRWIRYYRRTFWQRLADRLQAEADKLDHDPEVTAEGDYLCFAGRRVHSPLGAERLRRHEIREPPLEG